LTRAYERTLQAIGDGGPHRWPSRRPCGLPRLLGHGRHQKTQIRFCYRGISTSSKKPTTTASAPHELHLRLPPSPLSTYPPGGEGSSGRIPNILPLVVGGEWYGKSTLSSSALSPERDRVCHPANRYPASPRKKIASAIGQEPYAIDIRLPPGNDCICNRPWKWKMRESSGPTLATRGTTIRMIVSDDLLFLKARRQGRREDVKWHGCALVVGRETRTNIIVLDIVSEGGTTA